MIICYFGDYDPDYARNRVIIKGFKENGIKVIECNVKYGEKGNWRKLIEQHKKIKDEYDLMVVGYSPITRSMVPLVKLLSNRSILWDAFFSLYDMWVNDKKLLKPYNPKAWLYWFYDWFSSVLADKILLDTNEHIKYFSRTFKIKKAKFIKVLVGSDEKVFFPREKKKSGKFIIHFHGNYIPLQGTEYIVRAAKILEERGEKDIEFRMIGSKGVDYKRVRDLADNLKINNIKFIKSVPYKKLADYIREADICLGIFGNTDKTQRVIPNKVYEAIAMAKPVISANTPAIRELFIDKENILLCKTANPNDIANNILELKRNNNLREKIARGGYEIFNNYTSPKVVGKKLIADLCKIKK